MTDQKELIHSTPWDLLIILDCCRYDTFVNTNWMVGSLQKVVSAGSTTLEWVSNTFTGNYPDVVYVSSVPYISSRYNPDIHKGYKALEHFGQVLDLWFWAYNQKLGTVTPDRVYQVVSQYRGKGKRVIAHFMQPHSPMIGLPLFTTETWEKLTDEKCEGGRFPKVEDIFKKGHGDLYQTAYRGNLKLVLRACREIIGWSNKPVVTSDHGEGLGENGIYGHGEGIRTPELTEVPFFMVS